MEITRLPIDAPTLRAWIVDYVGSILDLPAGAVRTDEPLAALGLDSVEAVVMAGVLEEEFGVPIDPAAMFELGTIDAIVAGFAAEQPPA